MLAASIRLGAAIFLIGSWLVPLGASNDPQDPISWPGIRGRGVPEVVLEHQGFNLLSTYRGTHPRTRVTTYQLDFQMPDGTVLELESPRNGRALTWNTHYGARPCPPAAISEEGHLAVVADDLIVYLSPDYKPRRIAVLRTDLVQLELERPRFMIHQVVWHGDTLVMGGSYLDDKSRFSTPFLSRLFVRGDSVRDHQILWALELSQEAMESINRSAFLASARAFNKSMHVQDGWIYWRSIGWLGRVPPPDLVPADFHESRWMKTELATGTTQAVAPDDIHSRDLRKLDQHLLEDLEWVGNHSPEAVERLKEALKQSVDSAE